MKQLPKVPREIPQWEREGDFSCFPYYDIRPLNRKLTFINGASLNKVKKIEFLGYRSHHLRVLFKFKTEEFCDDFVEFVEHLSDQIVEKSSNNVYFEFSSQKKFDEVMSIFHQLYPLSQEMLDSLPYWLNTRIPKRVTAADWLQSYPAFDSEFQTRWNKFDPENALSYALSVRTSGPSLSGLNTFANSRLAQMEYVVKEINYYFGDEQLALVAPHQTGKLPDLKPGYYIVSLHSSMEKEQIYKNNVRYYQMDDFHFIVQNNDGHFSHRRGDKLPERVDSENWPIICPELATLFYVTNLLHKDFSTQPSTHYQVCVDYCFIGYLYFKTTEMRLGLPTKSYELLDSMEAQAKVNLQSQNKLSQFKGRFFMYPPLPEFFADAREQIENTFSSKL